MPATWVNMGRLPIPADWVLDHAQKIGDVMASGAPSSTAIVPATLSASDVHALTALVTGADGVTIRTTNIVTVLTAPLPGDFNNDGTVDAADLAQCQGDFGLNGDSDADNDGDSDGADFLAWQRQLGLIAPAVSANAAVPEPPAMVLILLAATGIRCMYSQMRQQLVGA